MSASSPFKLRTTDGELIPITEGALRLCGNLRHHVHDTPREQPIHVPVHSAVLVPVCLWLEKHQHSGLMLARGPARVSFRALHKHHAAATILLTLQTNTAISLDENAASPHLVLRCVRDTVSPPSVEIDMRGIRGLSPPPTDIVLGGVTCSSDPVLTLNVTWSGQSEEELEALRDTLCSTTAEPPVLEVYLVAPNRIAGTHGTLSDFVSKSDMAFLATFPAVGLGGLAHAPTLANIACATSKLQINGLKQLVCAQMVRLMGLKTMSTVEMREHADFEAAEDDDNDKAEGGGGARGGSPTFPSLFTNVDHRRIATA